MGEVSSIEVASVTLGNSSGGPADGLPSGEGGRGIVRYSRSVKSQEEVGSGFPEEVAVDSSPLEDEGADAKECCDEVPISDLIPVLSPFPGRVKYFSR